MDAQKIVDTFVQVVTALLPIVGVLGVFAAFSYYEKQKKNVSKADEQNYAALDKLWPLVTPEVTATMITQQPAAYFTISKLVAERMAAKNLKEQK